MRRRLALILISLSALLLAAAPHPHLVPLIEGESVKLRLYEQTLEAALLTDSPQPPLWQAMVLPSFSPEAALFMTARGGTTTVHLRVARGNLFKEVYAVMSGRQSDVSDQALQPEASAVELDPETAAALKRVWALALLQTRAPAPETTRGLDGTTYHFAAVVDGAGLREGKTWQPVAGSQTADLVAIVDRVRSLVEAPPSMRPAKHAQVLAQALALEARLKAEALSPAP